ncbi:MAG: hypothetical protein GXP14_15730 [Gammaproteobacteria bacterium]|nr:hypothetical protein [Gammaproteobacteria bacterium]
MFIESSSMAASLAMGVATVKAGSAALLFLSAATPVGWAGLIVLAAAASIAADHILKEESGAIYDSIMKRMNTR